MSFQKVGVIGSGIMGGGVAEVAAVTGATVLVRSRSDEGVLAVLAGIDRSLARRVEKGKLDSDTAAQLRQRISATTALTDLADCDFII
jgi:3-hydroxybutyryl-CoA dehydrogenase